MGFWTTERIKGFVETGGVLVSVGDETGHPVSSFEPKRVDCGAYQLSLGPEAYVTSASGTKELLEPNKQLVIPPGQFALLLTEEFVHVPNDVIGFISIRARVKLGGLINVSGFHVDPGFSGRLKFSVYNAGSQNTVLTRGEPLFVIWLADLTEPTKDVYKGHRQNQHSISSEDVGHLQGTIPSPVALYSELQSLKRSVRWWKAMIISVGVGLVVALLALAVDRLTDKNDSGAQLQNASGVTDSTTTTDQPSQTRDKEPAGKQSPAPPGATPPGGK